MVSVWTVEHTIVLNTYLFLFRLQSTNPYLNVFKKVKIIAIWLTAIWLPKSVLQYLIMYACIHISLVKFFPNFPYVEFKIKIKRSIAWRDKWHFKSTLKQSSRGSSYKIWTWSRRMNTIHYLLRWRITF